MRDYDVKARTGHGLDDEYDPELLADRAEAEAYERHVEHVHDWKPGKFLGVEDEKWCSGCGAWCDVER